MTTFEKLYAEAQRLHPYLNTEEAWGHAAEYDALSEQLYKALDNGEITEAQFNAVALEGFYEHELLVDEDDNLY